MGIIDILKERGFIQDEANLENLKKFEKNKSAAYIGVDPSAPSLGVHHFSSLAAGKWLRDAGHPVYFIVGGITGLIGDPRDPKLTKNAQIERTLQDKKVIEANVIQLKKQLKQYFDATEVLNNADFYKNMSVADYLRDIGKLINVNYMLEKDVIARRLETGISYAEFSYTLLQGYDSLWLYNHKKVVCQFGGADQWGNITTGLELIRKVNGSDNNACCFSCPLLLKPDGTKFGKSEGGTLWLDPKKTSSYEIYQFFINQPDSMVETLIMRLTFIPTKTAKKIIADHNKNPSAKLGQNTLAENVVTFLRGKEEYLKAKKISDALFSGNVVNLSNDELFTALSGTRVFNATKSSYNIVDLLVEAKVCNSKTEGRQLISQKNIVYNNIVVETNDKVVDNKFSFTSKKTKFSFIKKGKKDWTLIIW